MPDLTTLTHGDVTLLLIAGIVALLGVTICCLPASIAEVRGEGER